MANFMNRGSRYSSSRTSGFSLVELLVALAFTGILMAGMAKVFKSSLSSFYTSGEILSSARRNRASIDLLYDDLNSAGMYLTSLSAPPAEVSAGSPAFAIVPNQALVPPGGPDDPVAADQLFFYLDQPLAFEGRIKVAGNSASEIINVGGVVAATDSEFQVDCGGSELRQAS
ncbi:MAG: prepilin-type N-terminal cleavage/methylation domain-containing protein [Holophagaceae bacterium]|nr:prepilin-type N-terminal cleavage/methylation domain-containing protein [Holophagaceae bacterium]